MKSLMVLRGPTNRNRQLLGLIKQSRDYAEPHKEDSHRLSRCLHLDPDAPVHKHDYRVLWRKLKCVNIGQSQMD